MAYVTLTNISVLDNPTSFLNPFQFEVTFECIHSLDDDLEWKITYVGSAENENHDQVLEEVLVGPIPVGTNKFVFQANPPNPQLVPDEDKIGVTVVLVTCSYKDQEFVRVGYYVNNDYADPVLQETPPETIDLSKLQRNILADKPRVTRFPIDWNSNKSMDDDGDGMLMNHVPGDENSAMGMMETEEAFLQAAAELDDEDDLIIGGSDDMMQEEDEDEEDDGGMEMDDDNIEIDL